MKRCEDSVELEDCPESVYQEAHATGVYRLRGSITSKSCMEASQFIFTESMRGAHASVCLVIDSDGGDVNAAFSLIAFIRSSVIPVNCVAVGSCASAALFIAMACETRVIDENCAVLSHQYSADFGDGKHLDLMARANDLKMTAGRIEQLYVRESKQTLKYVRKNLLRADDVFMNAQSAVDHGMFDGMLHDNIDVLYNNFIAELEENHPKVVTLNENVLDKSV